MSELLKKGTTLKSRIVKQLDKEDLAEFIRVELFEFSSGNGFRAAVTTKTLGNLGFLWDYNAKRQSAGVIQPSRVRWLIVDGDDEHPRLTDRNDQFLSFF